jgi:hypothetical protein
MKIRSACGDTEYINHGPLSRAERVITINVPLFEKLRDIIFFCGTITITIKKSRHPQNVPRNGSQKKIISLSVHILSGGARVQFPDDAVEYLAFGEKYWDILGYKDI